jgi:ribosomal protein S18 acetylase RimI-like enzyme
MTQRQRGRDDRNGAERMPDGITIELLPPADLDELKPAWRTLLDHVHDRGSVVPIRPFEDSWRLERQHYVDLMADGGFVFVARRAGAVIGYAMARVDDADPVWYTGAQYGELVTLSVLPEERGDGVGDALFAAVENELTRRGIDDMFIGVDCANTRALRFYERRGYKVGFHLMYGSPGRADWSADERAAKGGYETAGEAPPAGPIAPPPDQLGSTTGSLG